MEERLITVTDDKGTVLRPINATYEVDYKYSGEATAERVLEGDVRRGMVSATAQFPTADPAKDLEYSEVIIKVKSEPKGWDAYSSKTRRFMGTIPMKDTTMKGVDVMLPFVGTIPANKEDKRMAMQTRRDAILKSLQERYPPKIAEQLKQQ